MGKFNITESEKKSIRKMYGLIEEQIQLPKIVSGSFSSSDGNSAHNFKQLETKLDQILPQLYNQGINPKITSVTAQIKKNGNQFVTNYSVTIDKSNDGKAWMGFTSRGSSGNEYQQRADGQIDGSANEDGRSLEEKLKSIGAGEIEQIKGSPIIDRLIPFKQYFVQFTKPSKYPSIDEQQLSKKQNNYNPQQNNVNLQNKPVNYQDSNDYKVGDTYLTRNTKTGKTHLITITDAEKKVDGRLLDVMARIDDREGNWVFDVTVPGRFRHNTENGDFIIIKKNNVQ